MMNIFESCYRMMAKATISLLITTLAFLGLALLCALLGFRRGATSFSDAAGMLAIVFGAMLAVFLLTSLVVAVVRYLHSRSTRVAQI